ncbi:carboxypeptidase-like regulatory domain-containing protein [Cohnella lubricantis]|uniref:Carboxypeptidase regulatory-like domain-containing protein n=1 Tax=Cohnella lubricantis TaxID=2163172 RepID=A0A841T7C6_9BACL|nr:carboxypeptidase-like regulatory domain-containing protein [Cohnella lubricantis]MBB6676009.1 carboxypeptidase regulatory-like domain-containing protein [Cohnella lubricantis]MBP2117978.1 hypothetical protein [Cohnella lubricantis]
MKMLSKSAVFVLLAASLAACSNNNENAASPSSSSEAPSASASASAPATASSAAISGEVKLEIDQTMYTLKQWQEDGSHTVDSKGKLLIGDQPVAHAIIHVGDSKRDIETAEDGSFDMIIDQSLLSQTPVRVVSLDNATVAGQPIGEATAEQLLSETTYINVYYPIETTEVVPSAKDPSQVEVHGRVISQPGDVISFFQIDKYRVGGIVKDADGNPVKGADVWLDRDGGEGFAKSTPTDENGRYYLYYLPEEEEGTNLTVTTDNGSKRYTLPEGRVYHIPDGTSVDINITLPREGTEIVDKPPTLVSVTEPGAMYTGVLVGLNVDSEVNYTVTIPDKDGNFVITVPKTEWEKNPTFFETKMTKYVEGAHILTWGDELPSSFIEPGKNDPRGIVPEHTGA